MGCTVEAQEVTATAAATATEAAVAGAAAVEGVEAEEGELRSLVLRGVQR